MVLLKTHFCFKKLQTRNPRISQIKACVTKVHINEKWVKINPDEFKNFYDSIMTWLTTTSETTEIDE